MSTRRLPPASAAIRIYFFRCPAAKAQGLRRSARSPCCRRASPSPRSGSRPARRDRLSRLPRHMLATLVTREARIQTDYETSSPTRAPNSTGSRAASCSTRTPSRARCTTCCRGRRGSNSATAARGARGGSRRRRRAHRRTLARASTTRSAIRRSAARRPTAISAPPAPTRRTPRRAPAAAPKAAPLDGDSRERSAAPSRSRQLRRRTDRRGRRIPTLDPTPGSGSSSYSLDRVERAQIAAPRRRRAKRAQSPRSASKR